MRKTRQVVIAWAMAVISLCGVGCSDSAGGEGTLRVQLTDAPLAGDISKVNVSLKEIKVHWVPAKDASADAAAEDDAGEAASDKGGWITVAAGPIDVDLMTIRNGVTKLLGEQKRGAGKVTQIRLIVDKASLEMTGGKTMDMEIPSADKTGIKIVGNFEIKAGVVTELVLDFDAEESVSATGNGQYRMKPTIKIKSVNYIGEDGGTAASTGDGGAAPADNGKGGQDGGKS
ncbi:MAG: hypothetical protein GMKNLPBB_00398 [Myxococcota bacterium]|nr:hypothetical protein [Myxococcota bacterium]